MYEFTANDFNEVKTAVQQDIIAPSASALKHKLQVTVKLYPQYIFSRHSESVFNIWFMIV